MSAEKKQEQVREIKTYFRYAEKDAEHLSEQSKSFDKELSQKISKVKEAAGEVVKYIDERQNG